MTTIRKDLVVVGLGAFGSGALWRLAERGADVAGVERFGVAHQLGASHGATRTFRLACYQHAGLGAIAVKTLGLWTDLGRRTGERLVHQTGALNVGPPESRPVRGTLSAAAAACLPVSEIGHEEFLARYPQYSGVSPDTVAVWDPGGGICYPDRNVRAQVTAAERAGAEIYPNTMAMSIEPDGQGVTVHTPTAEFRAQQVIVCAGAWLGKLVPGFTLAPRRVLQYWFRPRDPQSEDFSLARFPAFTWYRSDSETFWGNGSDEDFGIKIGPVAVERRPENLNIDPDEMDRHIHADTDIETAAAAVSQVFPGLDPRPAKVIPCMVTDSADGQFIVGRLTSKPRVIVAGGDSGHGFKHAAGVGELLAQIALDERPFCETAFMDPARFSQ